MKMNIDLVVDLGDREVCVEIEYNLEDNTFIFELLDPVDPEEEIILVEELSKEIPKLILELN